MLDNFYDELLDAVNKRLTKVKTKTGSVHNGKDTGLSFFDLMCESQDTLPPKEILDFAVNKGKKAELMWDEFGKMTIDVISRGCKVQARIWEAAWKPGNGDDNIKTPGMVDRTKVKNL